MFVMHVSFDLAPGATPEAFARAWAAFAADLVTRGLLLSASAVAVRRSDTPLDTDEERSHGYFAAMRFRDRAQSEAAWDAIEPRIEPMHGHHRGVMALVARPVFSCWEEPGAQPAA